MRTEKQILQRRPSFKYLKFIFVLLFCFQANGQLNNRAFSIEKWDRAISKNTSATYFDLLLKIFPEAEGAESSGNEAIVVERAIRLRNLDHPQEIAERKGTIEINNAEALWITSQGAPRLVMLINANHTDEQEQTEEINVLAVFSVSPKLQLIDAAEVDFDRWIEFWEKATLLTIRQGEMAFWLRATHHNSSEGFHSYSLIALFDNRLRVILDKPLSFIDAKYCGYETTDKLKIGQGSGLFAGHRVFHLSIRSETQITGDDCESEKQIKPVFKNKIYRVRWNARQKRYQATLFKTTSGKLPKKIKRDFVPNANQKNY